jgi:hypothetical protein
MAKYKVARGAGKRAAKGAGGMTAKTAVLAARQKAARAALGGTYRDRRTARSGMSPMRSVFMGLGAVGFAALFWKELPAMRRYIKIEMM